MSTDSDTSSLGPGIATAWRIGIKGLLDGEHIYEIQPVTGERVILVQRECFGGQLVPVLWGSMENGTRLGFNEMNVAVKKKAEERD